MSTSRLATLRLLGVALLAMVAASAVYVAPAAAQDKVKVGVFPVSSSLPYFVAIERGFFKEVNIEPETIRLMGGPPNVAALITNQIEARRPRGFLNGRKPSKSSPR